MGLCCLWILYNFVASTCLCRRRPWYWWYCFLVGYVVARMEGVGVERHGYILSLGVLPTHRKLGVARKLMTAVQNAMVQEYGFVYVSLHVRISNHAAVNLYTKILGYEDYGTTIRFYDDGEDAL
ncbi:hypothetical protein MKW98_008483 [Papaver atlanticum]|uniref:N-acetyltransferase domain-containing protein n=1 Tax=Papaver atlanticum TaxID=357466 RepID=A0AAD4XYG6_9MAGN|nr:hypothetical protein MKW98_008483 [Papaver atlanticum]